MFYHLSVMSLVEERKQNHAIVPLFATKHIKQTDIDSGFCHSSNNNNSSNNDDENTFKMSQTVCRDYVAG